MEWLDSWLFTLGILWFVGIAFFVALVSINPPDREEELVKDLLQEDRERQREAPAFGPANAKRA
ncbi:MAG TPA: hypothetical protein VM491_06515 [Burkholderiaceae bacterium]|jgi:hypothetical protein|nr:hypothetical protein [Burkholderiaceae bacterium]